MAVTDATDCRPGQGARHVPPLGGDPFDAEVMSLELAASPLKTAVNTLMVMLGWTNRDGWTCISKARIAAMTNQSERTVQRHWETARKAGYLVTFDYHRSQRRTSDHWLTWPGRTMPSPNNPWSEALVQLFPKGTTWEQGLIILYPAAVASGPEGWPPLDSTGPVPL